MHNYRTKILCVTVPYPGVMQWLEHGYQEGFWNLFVITNQLWLHKLKGEVWQDEKPEWIIFGAWHPLYHQVLKAAQSAGIKVAIAWSSSATEMEQAPVEIEAVAQLQKPEYGIKAWLCLQPDMAPHFPNGVHLPAPIHLVPRPEVWANNGIGFYAPATPKKNIFAQLLAIRGFQKQFPRSSFDSTLYTNLDAYKGIMDQYGIDYVLEPWVESRKEHLQRVSARWLHMAVSHAESFCYAAVDACMMGHMVLGSPTIEWLPDEWKVKNPNSPSAIQAAINRLWTARGPTTDKAKHIPHEWVQKVAESNNIKVQETLDRLLGLQ